MLVDVIPVMPLVCCSLSALQNEFLDAGADDADTGTLSAEQFDEWKERFKVSLSERMQKLADAKQQPPTQTARGGGALPAGVEEAHDAHKTDGIELLEKIEVEVRDESGQPSTAAPGATAGGGCCMLQ